jgi:hypothetical protein
MQIGILDAVGGLSRYYAEILQTWGLRHYRLIKGHEFTELSLGIGSVEEMPVLIVPAGVGDQVMSMYLQGYMNAGGTVIAAYPGAMLAGVGGLEVKAEDARPLRLRLSALAGTGLAGEPVPVVGGARVYGGLGEGSRVFAHLWAQGEPNDLGPGIFSVPVGAGRLVVMAFDLAKSVLYCRQGDPAKAGRIPPHAPKGNEGCRAVNMVADVGGSEPATIPYADALARGFVELVRLNLPGPAPMLWHLPGETRGVVVYSGDEDWSPVHMTRGQMESLTAAGARMNLYVILHEQDTPSSAEDLAWYLKHHDLGPHPNLRPFDNVSMEAKLDEFERQIKLVEERTGVKTRSLRNHHVVWIGYMEQAERMEKLGVRMDGNYNYGSYLRSRNPGSYAGWGAGMPMRFCTPHGRMIDVMQQHTHVGDDHNFSTFAQTDYSYRMTPEVYDAQVHLTLSDAQERFHVPYAVNIHPSNWGKFSGSHSDVLLAQANKRGMRVYSFDQWSIFWDARDGWKSVAQTWKDGVLTWRWEGGDVAGGLSGYLPAVFGGKRLSKLSINGKDVPLRATRRHLVEVVTFELPGGAGVVEGKGEYGAPA